MNERAQMKRNLSYMLLFAFVILLFAGVAWKTLGPDECVDEGGSVIGPMTRGQRCADP
jgi:hypothetical protein